MTCIFIDTFYENASPLRWAVGENGAVELYMSPDHERFSPNSQLTHWNFKAIVPPQEIGSKYTFRIAQVYGAWNGQPAPQFGQEGKINIAVSYDGHTWESAPTRTPSDEKFGLEFEVEMKSATVQIARNEPYTDSDLQRTLDSIRSHPATKIYNFGSTPEGRALEMVEIGNPQSPNQVFFRGRAHPWESGGSWVLDGMMKYLTSGDGESEAILDEICFCIMPMACKDGVYRGMTRFNVNGIDLNRNWHSDKPADATLAPENACLQNWFAERLRQNKTPKLAICLHNDGYGQIHISHPEKNRERYYSRVDRLEELMREMTWFTEGSTPKNGKRNVGSFGEGIIEMYGIDAIVLELNAEWAAGLNRPPQGKDWQKFGADYARVMRTYMREFFGEE